MTEVQRRLSDDHHAVAEVLEQVLAALDNKDVETSHDRLDLLWARLAVHIRAEHLHLFPAVTNRFSEAQAIVEKLRADHDFFMHELAQAIGILRERDQAKLDAVAGTVREIEKRLANHNQIEENQIYRWTSTLLTQAEQLELLAQVNVELENRPSRFSEDAWTNNP